MKNAKALVFLFITGFVLLGWLTPSNAENNNDIPDEISDDSFETLSETQSNNPWREYYDAVIVDQDGWEICLYVNRIRRAVTSYGNGQYFYCVTYDGCERTPGLCCEDNAFPGASSMIWYQVGSYIFAGWAMAVYDNVMDQITVVAMDSEWNGDTIVYSLKFTGDTDLQGAFVYREYPRRTNSITARLVHGRLGNHCAGDGCR